MFSSNRAFNIIQRYPNYHLCIDGIGQPPEGYESFGECSQIACFVRLDIIDSCTLSFDGKNDETSFDLNEKFNYRSICCHDYPVYEELRSKEEIILHEAQYFFERYIYLYDEEFYYNFDRNLYEFPLQKIYEWIKMADDINELKEILLKNYKISENDLIEVPCPENDESNEEIPSNDDDNDGKAETVDEPMNYAKSEEEW